MKSMDIQTAAEKLLCARQDVILTGEKNSGKSTLCMHLASVPSFRLGGFISAGMWEGNEKTGYQLYRPATGERILLASRDRERLSDSCAADGKLAFLFSKEAFIRAEQWLADDLSRGVQAVCIDEVGPLELQKQGFYDILRPGRRSDNAAYLFVVRRSLLPEVTALLSLDHAEILDMEKKPYE